MKNVKINDVLLYSTCTLLAYRIAKEYYNNVHYVWCTEAFDAALQPGTSNPRTLCTRYLEQIIKNDRHAVEIRNNRTGILKGASEKLKQGVINEQQYKEIAAIVAYAKNEEFYPVIYLINKKAVKKRLKVVEKREAASDSSIEYIIDDLNHDEFEIISVKDILNGVVYPVEN